MEFLKQRKYRRTRGQHLKVDLGHLNFFLPLGHTQDLGPAPWGDLSAATPHGHPLCSRADWAGGRQSHNVTPGHLCDLVG